MIIFGFRASFSFIAVMLPTALNVPGVIIYQIVKLGILHQPFRIEQPQAFCDGHSKQIYNSLVKNFIEIAFQ